MQGGGGQPQLTEALTVLKVLDELVTLQATSVFLSDICLTSPMAKVSPIMSYQHCLGRRTLTFVTLQGLGLPAKTLCHLLMGIPGSVGNYGLSYHHSAGRFPRRGGKFGILTHAGAVTCKPQSRLMECRFPGLVMLLIRVDSVVFLW